MAEENQNGAHSYLSRNSFQCNPHYVRVDFVKGVITGSLLLFWLHIKFHWEH